jgi:6,7-dimethyl-8-ribityllumazine synthase
MTDDKPHILIVEARFYDDLLDAMLKGAKRVLDKAHATYEIVTVPGALEIPGAIKFAHEAGNAGRLERRFDGYVAIGCVIRGETPHFDYVAGEAASGLQLAALETGIPVSFGVLTCDTREQAEARAGGAYGNKGAEAARSALEMADVFGILRARAGQ